MFLSFASVFVPGTSPYIFQLTLAGAYGRQMVHIKSLVVVVVNSAVKLAYMGVAVVIAELPGCTYG